MERIFLTFYDSIRKNSKISILLLLIFSGVAIWSFSQLQFREDITKLLPNNEKLKQVNLVFENSRFMDKMIMTVYAKDSIDLNQDELIKAADELVAQMDSQLSGSYIQSLKYTLPKNAYAQLFDEFNQNLPLFLDSSDYKEISKK